MRNISVRGRAWAMREDVAVVCLIGLAVGMVAIFSLYLFLVPQTPGRLERTSAELFGSLGVWQAMTGAGSGLPASPTGVLAVVLAAAVAAFAIYAAAVRFVWDSVSRRIAAVATLAGIVFLTLPLVALPNQTSDIWDYIGYGRVLAVHGASPYAAPISAFPDDPLFRYASLEYRDLVDNKLPVWTLLSTGIAAVAGSDPIRALLTYRAALWLMNLASLGLVVAVLRRTSPERVTAGIVLWAWNPIVVVWGEKTDALMVLLLLLASLAVVVRRPLAVVPLMLSALVKLITLPLLGLELVGEARRRGLRRAAGSAAVAAAVAALVYLPFYRSPALLAEHAGLVIHGASFLPDVLRPLALAGLAALAVWLGWWRTQGARSTFMAWALVLLYFATVLTVPSFSWYLMSLIAMSAIVVDGRLTAVVIPVGLASFLVNAREYVLSPGFTTEAFFVPPRGVLYVGIAALVVAAGALMFRRFGSSKSGSRVDR